MKVSTFLTVQGIGMIWAGNVLTWCYVPVLGYPITAIGFAKHAVAIRLRKRGW